MRDKDARSVIADEDAIERRYAAELAKKAQHAQSAIRDVVRNTWTHTPDHDMPRNGELIGRVALEEPQDELEGRRDFYIGTARLSGDDFEVFSWAAPVACTFYRPTTDLHHDYCEQVVVVRVLTHERGHIADFEDVPMTEDVPTDVFPSSVLEIPRAPVRAKPVAASPAVELPSETPHSELSQTGPSSWPTKEAAGEVTEDPPATALSPSATSRSATPPGPPLRAAELLKRQLAAPKSVAMSAVLSTLQSDQYDAITHDSRESQILQGHPGTGKTVVATHRAAYMLSADSPDWARPSGEVLIVGPTAEYVEHISAALSRLIGENGKYRVLSMPDLLEELAGLARSAEPTESVSYMDVDQDLARLVDEALKRAKNNIGEERLEAADVYAELMFLLDKPPNGVLEGEWARYLRGLPKTYADIKRDRARRHRGLLAYIGVRTARTTNPGHVIIDEAQDVSPIEWEVLGRLGNRGGWTILGDLNQRRTDHTFSSWDEVARILAIEDEDGLAPVRVLERGYRSTAQIIAFANQLLPREDRKLYSMQQGGQVPSVVKVAKGQKVVDEALSAAIDLLGKVGRGTVAIIGSDQRAITARLSSLDWKTVSAGSSIWTDGARELRVLIPQRARGLEFDAVVVVEPADFPVNVGRQGVLYTALTRANRLLTVVHGKPLPGGLKAPR